MEQILSSNFPPLGIPIPNYWEFDKETTQEITKVGVSRIYYFLIRSQKLKVGISNRLVKGEGFHLSFSSTAFISRISSIERKVLNESRGFFSLNPSEGELVYFKSEKIEVFHIIEKLSETIK